MSQPLPVIHSDPTILNGLPLFRGTDVPVVNLFVHLEQGGTEAGFLADSPGVTASQVEAVLTLAEQGL